MPDASVPAGFRYTVVNQRLSSSLATSARSCTDMNTRLEIGYVAGSRPAFSSSALSIGTQRENVSVLEPPEPIQPSATVTARRTASGWSPPSQIGGCGLLTGLRALVPASSL